MKKRFVFIILVIAAVFAVFLLRRCVPVRTEPVKSVKKESVSSAVKLPGLSLKKALKDDLRPGEKDYDVIVLRLDSEGNTKWTKIYGTTGYDWADFIIQSEDGGFLALCRTYNYGGGNSDYNLIKLDSFGNSLWSKTISGTNEINADSVAQAVEGGYIITGKTFSDNTAGREVFLAKTDEDGNYEWVHNYGREYYDWGYSAVLTADGSSVIIGQEEDNTDESQVTLRKKNNDGKYAWERTYGKSIYDRGYVVVKAAEHFLLAGSVYQPGSAYNDAYFARIDSDGKKIWDKTYGGSGYEEIFSVCNDGPEAFAAAGITSSGVNGGYDVLVMKIDADGNSLWSTVFGREGNEAAYSINRLKDGGYIIAGTTNSVWR